MEIPIYLALFCAEFSACQKLPSHPGWMSCHFSSAGDGLTNIPMTLPPGSLLIFDDSTPYQNHNCELILSQLSEAVSTLNPDAVLLDFQRPNIEKVQSLTKAIVSQLPCPVAVSSCYASTHECSVFLPPAPLWQPLENYLKPYQGRPVWLDAAPACAQIIVTRDSSQYIPVANEVMTEKWHFDTALHCHYHIKIEESQIIFTLSRSCSDLVPWLEEARKFGVSCAVGLYQELKEILY